MNQRQAFDKLQAIGLTYSVPLEVEEFLGKYSLMITSFIGSPNLRDIQQEFGQSSIFFTGKMYGSNNSGLVLYF